PGSVEEHNEMGLLPTYNFKQGQFERIDKITGHYMRDRIVATDKACFSCNTPCNKFSIIREGKYAGGKVVGPEYETISMLGSNIGLDTIEAVANANIICDKLGIDTISAGNVLGFTAECLEKGLITQRDLDGVDLRFGSDEAVMNLLEKIGNREGAGELLAQGVRAMAKVIGKGSEKFAMQVKGLEYPGYVPAASPAFALEYAVTDRGGCHRRAWPVFAEKSAGAAYTTEGRAKLIKELFDKRLVLHSAIFCDLFFGWSGSGWEEFKNMVKLVMGIEMTDESLQLIAERGFAASRAFNVREGATRADDILDFRTMNEKQPIGPAKGKNVTREMLDEMLDEYYRLRGWDVETGIPAKEILSRLGIGDLMGHLDKRISG
ncbi:MAG: aldehyde ferredoxin oxidoreductase C-terminal domain-containing protein, partial [Candidatus Bathyarchaeia archaeon]